MAQPGKASALDVLWGVLGGYSPGATKRGIEGGYQQQQAAQAREAEIQALARQNITDPRELLNFLANRKAYTESSAKNYEPQGVAGGNSVQYQGPQGPITTAPLMGVSGDQGYTQTPDNFSITGQRAPSFAENTNAEQVKAQIAQAIAELTEKARHNRQSEGIGWYNARKAPGGVGSGTAPPPPPGFEVD